MRESQLSCRGIRDAGVEHHRTDLACGSTLAVELDRSCAELVLRERGGAGSRLVGDNDSQIEPFGILPEASVDARGLHALSGTDTAFAG